MNNRFMSAFLIVPDEKSPENSFLLILTLENIIYLSFKSKKKVFFVNSKMKIGVGYISEEFRKC